MLYVHESNNYLSTFYAQLLDSLNLLQIFLLLPYVQVYIYRRVFFLLFKEILLKFGIQSKSYCL